MVRDTNATLGLTADIPRELLDRAARTSARIAARLGASPAELADFLGAIGVLDTETAVRVADSLAHTASRETVPVASTGRSDPSEAPSGLGPGPHRGLSGRFLASASPTCGRDLHPRTPGNVGADGTCQPCRWTRRRQRRAQARPRRDPRLCHLQAHVRTEKNMRRRVRMKGDNKSESWECTDCERERHGRRRQR